mgnify:CR=1 FL=1
MISAKSKSENPKKITFKDLLKKNSMATPFKTRLLTIVHDDTKLSPNLKDSIRALEMAKKNSKKTLSHLKSASPSQVLSWRQAEAKPGLAALRAVWIGSWNTMNFSSSQKRDTRKQALLQVITSANVVALQELHTTHVKEVFGSSATAFLGQVNIVYSDKSGTTGRTESLAFAYDGRRFLIFRGAGSPSSLQASMISSGRSQSPVCHGLQYARAHPMDVRHQPRLSHLVGNVRSVRRARSRHRLRLSRAVRRYENRRRQRRGSGRRGGLGRQLSVCHLRQSVHDE